MRCRAKDGRTFILVPEDVYEDLQEVAEMLADIRLRSDFAVTCIVDAASSRVECADTHAFPLSHRFHTHQRR